MGECGYSVWYMVCSGNEHSSSSSLSLSCRGTRMPAVCRRAPAVSPPALRASPLIRYGMHGEEKMEMGDTGKRQTMANGEAQSGHARDEASPFACKRCKSYPSLPRGGQPFWLSFLESCLHCPYHCPLRERGAGHACSPPQDLYCFSLLTRCNRELSGSVESQPFDPYVDEITLGKDALRDAR